MNLFKLKILLNIVKYINPFKKKKETIYLILRTWLNIALNEAYSCAKGFRKNTDLPSIKRIGTINLEKELSIMNEGCFNKEGELASLRSNHRSLQKELHKDEYKYYDLVELKTREQMRNVSKEKEFVPKLEFENTEIGKVPELLKDNVQIGYKSHVPFRCNPKEIELVNQIGNDIDRLTIKEASTAQGQLKRGEVKSLVKAKKGNEAQEPKQKNILVFTSLFLILFIKVAIICGLISEGVIVKNVAFNNLNYTIEESYLFASILLVIALGISRYLFNYFSRLLRSVREQWWMTGAFVLLFVLQLISAGVLSNFNIQRHNDQKLLESEQIQLAIKQGNLISLDKDEDIEEIAELQQEINTLKSNIDIRSEKLDNPPKWTIYIGYTVVGIMSVLTLFFTILGKVLGEVYTITYKLQRSIKKKRRRIAEIEELYSKEVKKLLTAYDQRHELVFYLSKKHVLETIIVQESSLNTQDFYNAYNIK
ncbi:MAG: hypothetical protein JXR05_16535 [Flavobacteriaceae bacterium]